MISITNISAAAILPTISYMVMLIRSMSLKHSHLIMNLGIVFGSLTILLSKLLVNAAFKLPFKEGSKIKVDGEFVIVEKIFLLFSIVKSRKERFLIWNSEPFIKFETKMKTNTLKRLEFLFILAAIIPSLQMIMTQNIENIKIYCASGVAATFCINLVFFGLSKFRKSAA